MEVHQQSVTSDDVSFDLRLWAPLIRAPRDLPLVPDTDDYSIDLTDQVGSTIDILLTGMAGADFSNEALELLDPNGNVVATGSANPGGLIPSDYDLGLLDYQVTTAGTHTVRIVSTTTGSYSIAINEGAIWESEPNDQATEPLRSLNDRWGAVGYLPSQGVGSVLDPRGDTVGAPPQHDILSVGATVDGDTLALSMTFAGPIEPTTPGGTDGLYVYFELDTDQDPTTGQPSFQSQYAPPGQQGGLLGVDYLVLVTPYAPDTATVFDLSFDPIGEVTLVRGDQSVEVLVPLSLIGEMDSSINIGSIAGHENAFPTDAAPDTSFLSPDQSGEVQVESDLYEIQLDAGQILQLETGTPLQESLRGQAGLDLELAILDADGEVIAEDQDSSADHRNAALRFTAPETATYVIRIQPQNGGGEYTLRSEIVQPGTVVERHLFYNNSLFDGFDPEAGPSDDAALAWDKVALQPGDSATWENYSSYSRGINGIMVDLSQPGRRANGRRF